MKKLLYSTILALSLCAGVTLYFFQEIKSHRESTVAPAATDKSVESSTNKTATNSAQEKEFSTLIEETTDNLPTTQSFKKIDNHSAHRTPVSMITAGKALGRLLSFRKEHPEFNDRALNFYHKCTVNGQSPKSIRALCLYNIVDIDQSSDLSRFAPDIVQLMKKIR